MQQQETGAQACVVVDGARNMTFIAEGGIRTVTTAQFQRYNDCGVCAVANARGVSWATAAFRIAPPAKRNWTEDASHENGNYECLCIECDQPFVGHKRRVICKACRPATPDEIADHDREERADELLCEYQETARRLKIALQRP